MSDYVPFEIQVEIMKRLPVKSLLRFRCVSKQLKSLMDSSEFMAAYNLTQSQPQRLLLWYKDPVSREKKFVSFVDDDQTFALQDFNLTVPVLTKQVKDSPSVLGSSQGLLCLFGYPQAPRHSFYNNMSGMVVLWNPSIRKSIGIALNGVLGWNYGQTIIGFGVCPTTNDPTIVKFKREGRWGTLISTAPWVVEVFSLSSGRWRIPSTNLPSGKIKITWEQIVIDKFIYWRSFEGKPIGGISTKNLIMSYDMTTGEIGAIELPDTLAHHPSFCLTLCKVRESLAMLEHNSYITDKNTCVVWMMDPGVPNLFTKLFTINTPNWSKCTITLGFTKSGKPILSTQPEDEKAAALFIYEPYSEQIKDIGNIDGRFSLVCVASYMETLLLHDQSDCNVYS